MIWFTGAGGIIKISCGEITFYFDKVEEFHDFRFFLLFSKTYVRVI